MATNEEVKILSLAWNEQTEAHLKAMRHDEPIIHGIEYYKQLCEAHALLFGVFVGADHVASIVAEIYEGNGHRELVILQACAGEGMHRILFTMFSVYEAIAAQLKCDFVSFDTTRKAVEVAAQQLGYQHSSIKLRKAV